MKTEQPIVAQLKQEPESEPESDPEQPEQSPQVNSETTDQRSEGYRPAKRGGRGSFERRLDELWPLEELDRLAGLPRQQTAENDAQPVAALARIWDAQGMSGRPTVVPPDARRKLRAKGHIQLFRGIGGEHAKEYAEQFRTGKKPYVGYSTYRGGGGTNFTTDPTGGRMGARFYASDGGVLMAAYLRRDAFVMPVERARALREKDRARALKLGRPKLAKLLNDDIGVWASLRGIDALVDPNGAYCDSLYLVQNRTALFVEKDPPPSMTERAIAAMRAKLAQWREAFPKISPIGRLVAGH